MNKKLMVYQVLKEHAPISLREMEKILNVNGNPKFSKDEIRTYLYRLAKDENKHVLKKTESGDYTQIIYSLDLEKLKEEEDYLKPIDFSIMKKLIWLMALCKVNSSDVLGNNDFDQLESKRISELFPIVKEEMI